MEGEEEEEEEMEEEEIEEEEGRKERRKDEGKEGSLVMLTADEAGMELAVQTILKPSALLSAPIH